MSREHRRPLLAFVLVTLLCTLVVGNSLTLGSPANRTLVAEVRAAVVGEPDDSVLLGGGLATQEGPDGDDVLASADPLYPFGLFTGSSDNSSDGPIADLRPPGVVSGQIVSPPAPPASGSPPAGPPVLGPTLSGESPPLTVPTVTESSPSPSTEPTPELTTDPEPSLEPEPTPEPTPEPEPALEPEPSPEPTPEPGAEPALVPVPEPEQAPEPDSVLTFADITNPDPAPVPAPEVTDLGTGEVAPKPATDGTNGTTG